MKLLKTTVRVVITNPKLQSSTVRKCEGAYSTDQIVGLVKLDHSDPKEPPSQILTTAGPIDSYDSFEDLVKKIGAL